MSAMSDFKVFLQEYHDGVMDCEAKANAALSEGKSDVYTEFMKKKAEKLRDLYGIAEPYLKKLPGEQQEEYGRALHRFYASANNGLRLNSSFYWSALLWNDDYKPGDTDNFQLFINDIPDD